MPVPGSVGAIDDEIPLTAPFGPRAVKDLGGVAYRRGPESGIRDPPFGSRQ
jgi:hypothetical protein